MFRSVSFISGNETETLRRRLKRKGTSRLTLLAHADLHAHVITQKSRKGENLYPLHIYTRTRARACVRTSLLFISFSLTDCEMQMDFRLGNGEDGYGQGKNLNPLHSRNGGWSATVIMNALFSTLILVLLM